MDKGITFKHFIIENGRTFKTLKLPLEKQGIVLIQGDNGAGKSTIWDLFEAVLYGSTPDEHKKDELTKNELDSNLIVCFEKNNETFNVSLKRRKGKWSYEIQKDNTPITEHSFTDASKSIAKIIGLTKAEFEGSVHLTQSTQHILIKSELSERKKYISNFFGIDDRYDQIHSAAKLEQDKIQEQISKLAGLSHTKQMLETELQNLELKDINELQTKLETYQKHFDNSTNILDQVNKNLSIWNEYNKYFEQAIRVEDPDKDILELEKKILENRSKIKYITTIKNRNDQAYKVNNTIDNLEVTKSTIIGKNHNILKDINSISEYEKELQSLYSIKNQNESVQNLRREIEHLPKNEEIPIDIIEKELVSLQIEYQTHAKNKTTKERGICTECGSKFTKQDVKKEIETLTELRENIDILNEDYSLIKGKNAKIKRRKLLEDHLAKVPAFSKENLDQIAFLESYIPLKKEYDKTVSALKILQRMDIEEEVDVSEIPDIEHDIARSDVLIQELKKCQMAKKLLPIKPPVGQDQLLVQKNSLHNELLNIKNSIQDTTHTIGEYTSNNSTHQRLTYSLNDINSKLAKLEDLKKEEFFWSKLVDAYGPKGLRIQQLEKMMNIIIYQLPVYCGVLFKEKKLNFKHKVDSNNVRILACREEIQDNGKINKFQHDISCFSGGEKDLMSTSFVLTLADCVPHHKKANILILDEVDAQLTDDGKYRFTNQLLPMLRKKHDSIFVISHSKETQTADIFDQVWEIEKTNHTSTLKITRLNQIEEMIN